MELRPRPILAATALAAMLGSMSPAMAVGPFEVRADAAQSALSERYTQLWTSMTAQQRSHFSRTERQWLHVTRWEEQRRCADALASGVATTRRADFEANCLAQVTLRRLQALQPASVAVR